MLSVVAQLLFVHAYPKYVVELTNLGLQVPLIDGEGWRLAHTDDKGTFNNFGKAFSDEGNQWTLNLCSMNPGGLDEKSEKKSGKFWKKTYGETLGDAGCALVTDPASTTAASTTKEAVVISEDMATPESTTMESDLDNADPGTEHSTTTPSSMLAAKSMDLDPRMGVANSSGAGHGVLILLLVV